jgi:hypothetical protein
MPIFSSFKKIGSLKSVSGRLTNYDPALTEINLRTATILANFFLRLTRISLNGFAVISDSTKHISWMFLVTYQIAAYF